MHEKYHVRLKSSSFSPFLDRLARGLQLYAMHTGKVAKESAVECLVGALIAYLGILEV